jgi:hypothetical protein
VVLLFYFHIFNYILALFARPIGVRLASEIFYDQPMNVYSNVYDLFLQGQIISDGMEVK